MKSGSRFCSLFLSALLLLSGAFCLAGAQVQPIFVPPWQDTMPSVQPTTSTWDKLSALLDQLSLKVTDLQNQVQTLNQQLVQSRSSLTESETALELSKKLRLQEATAASQAIRAAQTSGIWWQRLGLVATGALGGYIIYTKAPGALYGAAVGALVDAGAEILGSIRIHL